MNTRDLLEQMAIKRVWILNSTERDFLLIALEEKLFTPDQFNRVWAGDVLLRENGIRALREKLFTIEDIIFYELMGFQLEILLKENGLFALKETLITLAEAKFSDCYNLLEEKINNRVQEFLKKRNMRLQVVAQGERSITSGFHKLPAELLGKISSGFFNKNEHQLTTEIIKINDLKFNNPSVSVSL